MELHNLKPAEGSTHKRKRIARGQGSGADGTAGRGHKGAKSRSGNKEKRGFEGGQTPLQRRLPKRGFKNPNRVEYVAMNLDKLQAIVEKYNITNITLEALVENHLVAKNDKIKILGRGELNAAVNVIAHAASETAKKAIEAKGGSVTIV